MNGKFSQIADEIKLTKYLNLPVWLISAGTAFIGTIVLSIIIFKYVPKKLRVTFIISGLLGGIIGYVLWLELLGKLLMP